MDVNSGQLGKHLWVVEGTACYKGCGINQNDPAEVAIVHVLTLITDYQTNEVLFHFSQRSLQHLQRVAADGIHLRMKLQTSHSVANIDQRCSRVLLDNIGAILD